VDLRLITSAVVLFVSEEAVEVPRELAALLLGFDAGMIFSAQASIKPAFDLMLLESGLDALR
jgi:hypothetical protein